MSRQLLTSTIPLGVSYPQSLETTKEIRQDPYPSDQYKSKSVIVLNTSSEDADLKRVMAESIRMQANIEKNDGMVRQQ